MNRTTYLLTGILIISKLVISSCSGTQKLSEIKHGCETTLLEKGIVWKKWNRFYKDFGSEQTINIIDIDLRASNYILDWLNSKDKFQPVHQLVKDENALVAINGTYPDRDSQGRWGSFFKRNDSIYQKIEYPRDHPLYWKAEGCISINRKREIKIRLGNKALYEHLNAPFIMSASPVLVQENVSMGKYFLEGDYSAEELDVLDTL